MKIPFRCLSAVVLVFALAFWIGCENDSANESAVGPDISGEWSGRYYLQGSGSETPLTANITQNGTTVFIETSLPGPGRLLTGGFERSGYLLATDALNGETWTLGGTPRANRLVLIDYAFGPGSALQVIELSR